MIYPLVLPAAGLAAMQRGNGQIATLILLFCILDSETAGARICSFFFILLDSDCGPGCARAGCIMMPVSLVPRVVSCRCVGSVHCERSPTVWPAPPCPGRARPAAAWPGEAGSLRPPMTFVSLCDVGRRRRGMTRVDRHRGSAGETPFLIVH